MKPKSPKIYCRRCGMEVKNANPNTGVTFGITFCVCDSCLEEIHTEQKDALNEAAIQG